MSESAEQSALFAWASQVSFSYPALRLLYAIPNGGARNKITAAILKREGVRAGVPDICLPVPSGAYHALYIELKRTAQPTAWCCTSCRRPALRRVRRARRARGLWLRS